MKKLSRKEGIAVAVVFVVVSGMLLFSDAIFQPSNDNLQNLGQPVSVSDAGGISSGVLPDGLMIQSFGEGEGAEVRNGDMVAVHYTGMLKDGTKFDSSLDRNKPLIFTVGSGQLIKGFDEGVVGMKVGGKRRLIIPPDLGYGSNPVGPIPANSTLVFDVELISIKP